MSTADGSAYVLGGSTRKWLATAVRLARAAGFFAVYGFARSRLVEHEVAIILYHRIARPGSQPWSLMPTSPEDFEREMRYLRQRYQIVPLDELVSALAEWHALPPRLAAITFDDGYREIYTDAFPVLKRYAIPATVFLPTG